MKKWSGKTIDSNLCGLFKQCYVYYHTPSMDDVKEEIGELLYMEELN